MSMIGHLNINRPLIESGFFYYFKILKRDEAKPRNGKKENGVA